MSDTVINQIEELRTAHAELAAKVASLEVDNASLCERAHDLCKRLLSLESPAAPAKGCWKCSFTGLIMNTSIPGGPAKPCECQTAAPAPDTVCATCGHGQGRHNMDDGAYCIAPGCDCNQFTVPTEQPALDPVLVAIRDLYELIVPDPADFAHLTGQLAKTLRYEWERTVFPEKELFDVHKIDAAIRAYGKDGAR